MTPNPVSQIHRRRQSSPLAAAVLLLAALPVLAADGPNAVLARMNWKSSIYNSAVNGTSSFATNGTFSLHAGTSIPADPNAKPAFAGSGEIVHNPAEQPAAIRDKFPTKLTDLVSGGIVAGPAVNAAGYNTAAKVFNAADPDTSGEALALREFPGQGFNFITAKAEAKCKFTREMVNNKWLHTADPKGTEVSLGSLGNVPANVKRGSVGALVYDPLNFQIPDSTFSNLGGIAGLDKDDFGVQLNDPAAVAASTLEVGTNFPFASDPSANPLGNSEQGLPLVYRLNVTFSAADPMHPFIRFQFNPNFSFFDPDHPESPWSQGQIESNVQTRLLDMLTMVNGEVQLSDDLDLFGYTVDAQRSTMAYQIDYMGATMGVTPEPATIALLVAGLALIPRRRNKQAAA